MLFLIVTNWNEIRLVKQDVRCHQQWIFKKTNRDILPLLLSFVFVLCHPLELRHAGDAIEYPGELGVFVNVRLDEDSGDVRINADGQIDASKVSSFFRKQFGILRKRQSVKIDDAVESLVLVLECYPVAQCP